MNKIDKLELSLIVLTIICYFTTIVCGLYLGFSGEEVVLGDKIFHMAFAGFSIVFSFSTIIILLRKKMSEISINKV